MLLENGSAIEQGPDPKLGSEPTFMEDFEWLALLCVWKGLEIHG